MIAKAPGEAAYHADDSVYGSGCVVHGWLARGAGYEFPVGCCLPLANVLANCMQVIAEFLGLLVPDSMNFFHDWITPHVLYSSTSSGGVQITGGSYPATLQINSIFGRIIALAMCVQFHVSR